MLGIFQASRPVAVHCHAGEFIVLGMGFITLSPVDQVHHRHRAVAPAIAQKLRIGIIAETVGQFQRKAVRRIAQLHQLTRHIGIQPGAA